MQLRPSGQNSKLGQITGELSFNAKRNHKKVIADVMLGFFSLKELDPQCYPCHWYSHWSQVYYR